MSCSRYTLPNILHLKKVKNLYFSYGTNGQLSHQATTYPKSASNYEKSGQLSRYQNGVPAHKIQHFMSTTLR